MEARWWVCLDGLSLRCLVPGHDKFPGGFGIQGRGQGWK